MTFKGWTGKLVHVQVAGEPEPITGDLVNVEVGWLQVQTGEGVVMVRSEAVTTVRLVKRAVGGEDDQA